MFVSYTIIARNFIIWQQCQNIFNFKGAEKCHQYKLYIEFFVISLISLSTYPLNLSSKSVFSSALRVFHSNWPTNLQFHLAGKYFSHHQVEIHLSSFSGFYAD